MTECRRARVLLSKLNMMGAKVFDGPARDWLIVYKVNNEFRYFHINKDYNSKEIYHEIYLVGQLARFAVLMTKTPTGKLMANFISDICEKPILEQPLEWRLNCTNINFIGELILVKGFGSYDRVRGCGRRGKELYMLISKKGKKIEFDDFVTHMEKYDESTNTRYHTFDFYINNKRYVKTYDENLKLISKREIPIYETKVYL